MGACSLSKDQVISNIDQNQIAEEKGEHFHRE